MSNQPTPPATHHNSASPYDNNTPSIIKLSYSSSKETIVLLSQFKPSPVEVEVVVAPVAVVGVLCLVKKQRTKTRQNKKIKKGIHTGSICARTAAASLVAEKVTNLCLFFASKR